MATAWTVEAVAGWARDASARRRPTFAGRPTAIGAACVTAAALVALNASWVDKRIDQFDRQLGQSGELAKLQAALPQALDRAGGAERVVAFGPPSVNRAFQTRLSWEAHLSLLDVESAGAGEGLIFSVPGSPMRGVLPPAALTAATSDPPLARAGLWQVHRRLDTAVAVDLRR